MNIVEDKGRFAIRAFMCAAYFSVFEVLFMGHDLPYATALTAGIVTVALSIAWATERWS